MNRPTRWFRAYERRVNHGWEITKADPLPMIAGTLLALLIMSGCDSKPMSNEDFIADSAMCEANGYVPRTVRSTWDSDITGVECVPKRTFKPKITEFTLDDSGSDFAELGTFTYDGIMDYDKGYVYDMGISTPLNTNAEIDAASIINNNVDFV